MGNGKRRPTGLALIAAWLLCAGGMPTTENRLDAAEPARPPLLQSSAGPRDLVPTDTSGSERSPWSPTNLTEKIKQIAGLGPDRQRARQQYQEAESEFQAAVTARRESNDDASRKKFAAAAGKYSSAAKLDPDSSVEEDALFWAAEAHFFADRYPKASSAYSALVKKYPNTRYMDKVAARQFALADYWMKLSKSDPHWAITPNLTDDRRPRFDTFGNALKVFDEIRFDDPTGKLSDDATVVGANANFAAGRYDRADALYSDLRESFPDSEHQFNAHLLGLKCKMLIYEGPDYDGTVLDEAEELVQRVFRIFPNEAQKQRDHLEKALAEIRLKKAERKWLRAQYYDRRKEYGSARFYYEIVRREYHDTNLAETARDRLAQIGGLPADPPQRLAWLANLFPEPERAKPLMARNRADTQRR